MHSKAVFYQFGTENEGTVGHGFLDKLYSKLAQKSRRWAILLVQKIWAQILRNLALKSRRLLGSGFEISLYIIC
jgi:hypothetical protein